jgi:hypothetical protein
LRWSARLATLAGVLAAAPALGAAAPATPAVPAAPPPARTQLGAGLSIVVPAHWHVALRLTALQEPYERFTLASFALPQPPPERGACGPDLAVNAMPADGALAWVLEYPQRGATRLSFPPQPRRFVLPLVPAAHYDCFPRGWLVRFRVGARPFQIMVALGPRAGRNRARLLSALSTLRVARHSPPH